MESRVQWHQQQHVMYFSLLLAFLATVALSTDIDMQTAVDHLYKWEANASDWHSMAVVFDAMEMAINGTLHETDGPIFLYMADQTFCAMMDHSCAQRTETARCSALMKRRDAMKQLVLRHAASRKSL